MADLPPGRRPAGDLIEAVVQNMRTNLETLRYSTVAPSRYTVYVSAAEYTRLEGIIPRLRSETIRALDEELVRLNRGSRLRRAFGAWFGAARPLENADARWQVEFLPDMDGELQHDQDLIVQSDLILAPAPELGEGSRTRRVTTRHAGPRATTREETFQPSSPARTSALARLSYTDERGPHRYDIVRDSTTIGRGGTLFPVDVRVAASDDVSREHARIRHDPATGQFFLIDLSTHGTTIEGQPVPKGFEDQGGTKRENGAEAALPARTRIGLSGTVFLDFERLS